MLDFIAFLYLGILLIFVGMVLLAFRNLKKVKTEGGAVIMIGPIPIVIASNPKIARTLLVVGVAIFLVLIVLLLVR